MKKLDPVKIVGFAAMALGLVATQMTNWVDDKELDKKISEKVAEALSKANQE